MNIGKLCNHNVVSANEDTSVLEAARLMRHSHVGSIIITRDEGRGARPVGIITDRDLTVEIMAEGIDPESVTVGDAMTSSPLSAREDDEPFEVLEAMRSKGVRRIPVIDNQGLLVGVLAVDDIMRMLFHEMGNLVSLYHREFETEARLRSVV